MFSKAFSGMNSAPSAMMIFLRLVQPLRRSFEMPFKADGIVTSVKEEQLRKAFSPMDVDDAIVSLSKDEQPLKQSAPIDSSGDVDGYSFNL